MAKLSYGGGQRNEAVPVLFLVCSCQMQDVFQIYSHERTAIQAAIKIGQQLVDAAACMTREGGYLGRV